ncbi:MAG: hypothetical protein MK105_01490 [Crocinitomicaceae bacterium]|nr:hypothetical protein [Crocinitomicaceae bacterium]
MKNFMFVFAVAIVFTACSDKNKVVESSTTEVNVEKKIPVNANRLLTMEVEGMVCKMGCGGSIRKSLNATHGVAEVKFDFEEDRVIDVATISFDKNIVTVDEMIKIVSEMNDGQFRVGEISSKDLHEVITNENSEMTSAEEPMIEVSSSRVEIPNLLDLFSSIFTR